MLKSILFDMDETLVDWSGFGNTWLSLHQRNLKPVYDYLCEICPFDDADGYSQRYRDLVSTAWDAAGAELRAPNIGVSLIEAAAEFGVPREKIDLNRLLSAYGWQHVEQTRPFPEVIDMLRSLREAGLTFGIITNAEFPMALRDLELEAMHLAEFFPTCRFSAADHGYLKPHPSIFRAALDCLGSTAQETVFVGDDLYADIVGAKQAGIYAVYRRSRGVFAPEGKNNHIQPDATIADLTELPAVLDQAFPGWHA